MSTTASTSARPSRVADTALGQCSEDARRLPDTETRSKGSEDGETRRRKEQTSNPNQLLLLCGVASLILVVVRFINRRLNPPPPVPAAISRAERLAATGSEWTLYGLWRDGRLSR